MEPDIRQPNVLIGTPAYGGRVHVDFVHGLMDIAREQIRFRLLTIGNESLITRARNTIISAFHRTTDYSHLFFLDGDVRISGKGLARLLSSGKPVIGAPVALKRIDEQGNRRYNYQNVLTQDDNLMTVEHLGTAALLLSREAVQRLVEDAAADGRVYSYPIETENGSHTVQDYDIFQVGVAGGQYLSEDFWVCRKLRQLGFGIHLDTSVPTVHCGDQRF